MLWYLNPNNYGRSMYKMRPPGEKPVMETPPAEGGGGLLDAAIEAKCEGDLETFRTLTKQMDDGFVTSGHQCSILPLEDCYQVAELASPMAAMHCICRKRTRGREEDESNYSCLGIGTGMLKWERWPERYKGGVKFLSIQETKDWLKYWDDKGMVHMIMNYGGQIGGICNCDYPDCIMIRYRLDYGMDQCLIRSHYVPVVDYDLCTGCGTCVQRCQFGAIKFEITIEKTNIDLYRCFGCGVCETGCPTGAITLVDRASLPGMKNVW